jgi:hypothetical protein
MIGVRFPGCVRWLWCKGSMRDCDSLGPGSLPGIHPMRRWQSGLLQRPVKPPPSGIGGSNPSRRTQALVVQRTARRNPDPQVAGSTPAGSAIASNSSRLRYWRPAGARAPADILFRAPLLPRRPGPHWHRPASSPLPSPRHRPPRPESPLWTFRLGSRRRAAGLSRKPFLRRKENPAVAGKSLRYRKSIRANGLAGPGDGKSADARPPKESRLT